jgi:hypothetical protein
MNGLSVTASILGMVFGTAGLVLGVLNYLRDRAKVKVTLRWKMQNVQTGETRGLIRVTNVGRRPVFISLVGSRTAEGFGPHARGANEVA